LTQLQSFTAHGQLVKGDHVLFRGRYWHSHDCGELGCNRLLFAAVDGEGIRRNITSAVPQGNCSSDLLIRRSSIPTIYQKIFFRLSWLG
jgi:hypothetical protein